MLPKTAALHRGDVGHVTLFSPFVGDKHTKTPGSSFGHYWDGEPFSFDPRVEKRLGNVEGCVISIDGMIGSGKTSLLTKLVVDERSRAQGQGNVFRLYLEILRTNKGQLENQKLLDLLGVSAVDMKLRRLNLYDQTMGLGPIEQLGLLSDAIEWVDKRAMESGKKSVLTAAVMIFLEKCAANPAYSRTANRRKFFKCLAKVSKEDVARAIAEDWEENGDTQAPESSPDARPTPLDEDEVTVADIALDDAMIRRFRNECLFSLRSVGSTFNGSGSNGSLFKGSVVAVDLTKMTEDEVGFFQLAMWRYKTSARRRHDPDFIFSMEVYDENYRLWRHLAYAQGMADYLKIIRSTDAIIVFVTHRYDDMKTLPKETRDIALNAMNEPQIWFHGNQDEIKATSICARHEYDVAVKNWLVDQEQGCFVVRIGAGLPFRIHVHLVEMMRDITFTEAASHGHLALDPELMATVE